MNLFIIKHMNKEIPIMLSLDLKTNGNSDIGKPDNNVTVKLTILWFLITTSP